MILCTILYYLWAFQTIEEHNVVRNNHGLPILKIDNNLMMEANTHAKWMATHEMLKHSNICNGAESIAQAEVTPKTMIQLWMRSPGHRRNILNPKYTTIGFAIHISVTGKYYWCARFR
jgi:uncharacterized protein YkwD